MTNHEIVTTHQRPLRCTLTLQSLPLNVDRAVQQCVATFVRQTKAEENRKNKP